MDEDADQVVTGACSSLGDDLHRLVPGASQHLGQCLLARAQILVPESEREIGVLHVPRVVLLRRAQERPDHARDDGTGDIRDEVTLAVFSDAIERPIDDAADSIRVLRNALWCEAPLEEGLEAVVPRRIHRDHLLALSLERDAEVVKDEDPADL